MSQIKLGEKFATFEEFESEFQNYCKCNFHIFTKSASRFLKNETSKYEYVEFKCMFWRDKDEIKSKTTGVRPVQSYHSFNCPAEIRITSKKRENNMYVITKCNLLHENHPINKDIYMHHHTQRALSEQEQKEALDMYKAQGDVKLIAQTMSQRTGKVVLSKDIHNIKTKLTEKGEINRLQTLINQRIQIDQTDNFVFGENEEESKIYMIFYQNKKMKELYKKYPEILFIDGTYSLNRNNYPLYLFVVRDANGNAQIVAFAIIAYERIQCLNTIFQCFADNNDVNDTKAIMIDKDLTEWMLLKHHFKNSDIYLCKFHCVKIFERTLKNKSLLEQLSIMMESKTEVEANGAYEEILKKLEIDTRDKDYLNNNWFNCQEMWVKHFRLGKFTIDSDTNNYVETLNKTLKTFIKKNTTMDQCLEGVFNLLAFLEKQINYRTYKQLTTITIDHKVNQDEVYLSISRCCTPYAANIVYEQYRLSKDNHYKIEEEEEYTFLISKSKYKLTVDQITGHFICDCFDFSTNNLPCRHVFYLRIQKNLPIIEAGMIVNRWKHVSIREKSTSESETESNNIIYNMNGRRTIQMKNMNRIQSTRTDFISPSKTKFNECKRIINRLAEVVSRESEDVFNYRIQTLLQITNLWEKNELFSLKPIQKSNLFKESEVNKEDLSRYESFLNTGEVIEVCNASSSSTTLSTSSTPSTEVASSPSSSSSNTVLPSTSSSTPLSTSSTPSTEIASSPSSSTIPASTSTTSVSETGCFVKINLNGKSLVKSAPKRGAPTKAQRKRKIKEIESTQKKRARLDGECLSDQSDIDVNDESTDKCKNCNKLASDNFLVCNDCNFKFHRSCVKGYIPLKKSWSCKFCKRN